MTRLHAKHSAVANPVTVKGEAGGSITVSVSGRLTIDNLEDLVPGIKKLFDELKPADIVLDLAGVEYMDSAGALLGALLSDEARERSVPLRVTQMSAEERGIMGLVDGESLKVQPLIPEERSVGFVRQVGEQSIIVYEDMKDVIAFTGEMIIDLYYVALHPMSVRWRDVITYMKKVGVDGLPILGLISFLLGLIIAFMSSLQLKQFGANIYVASLVAVAMVRELGPIITAILVAGRSGSAFAAEIGTMKVNEEVDALTVMGFDPVRFLAIPKVIAAMMVVPILTLFADIFAISGGMVVGILGLDITIYTYVKQSLDALDMFNLVASIIKAMVFAILIAGIGCQRGFKVRGGAQAVGNATTSAVVAALFLIIVTDSTFAILLYYIK